MASTQSSGAAVRAGLVFQAVGLNEHLKIALREAGVNVVVEIIANALSLDKIRDASLDVFVVNLDPELEDSLDELTDMLDKMRRPVIFNDGAASSGLSGWDQARWARHLAAKITGELDASPPRPADAKSIPSPVRAATPKPVSVVVSPVTVVPIAATPLAAVSANEAATAALVERAAQPIESHASVDPVHNNGALTGTDGLDDVFAELDFDFDSQSVNTVVPVIVDDEESGLEGFDASAFDLPESAEPNFTGEKIEDLEELFRNSPQPTQTSAVKIEVSKAESPKAESPKGEPSKAETIATKKVPEPRAAVATEQNAQAKRGVEFKTDLSALNWSLEPLDGEVAPLPPTGRAVFVAREVPPIAEVVKPAAKSAGPAVVAPVESDNNELGDFDFFLESDAPEASPASAPVISSAPPSAAITKRLPAVQPPADKKLGGALPVESGAGLIDEMSDFDALFADLNDLSSVTMPATASGGSESAQSKDTDAVFESSSLDFDLDFEVGALNNSKTVENDDEFADLDALFADSPVPAPEKVANVVKAPIAPVAQTGPARVFVLGASIGGPEAIRSFLSKLKPKLPAAFVLAQHMGAEFLELMTSQLAKASPMPVRLAKPGEAFIAGEIIVVPVNQRFLIDQNSVVQFAPLPTESPYSPSIDQVMIDMADRFGQRCIGIVFSGMASDAIEGAKYLSSRGAKVWVQDPATCVISSMIDGAQAAGVVSFVGAPEQLADHVLDELGTLN